MAPIKTSCNVKDGEQTTEGADKEHISQNIHFQKLKHFRKNYLRALKKFRRM